MIGVGVVGYGYWGPNLARCFAEAPDCRLMGIADALPEAQAKASRKHPTARIAAEAAELIAAPDIDAIAIATPVRSHFGLARQALRAGKHVLLEKPMTETAEQARELIDEAERRGLVLMVDHTFCYTPAVRKIRELVQSGELGQIYYYVSSRMNLGLFQTDIDVIWDLAVHDISILQFCLGEQPTGVSACGTSHVTGRPANMAHVTLFYPGGIIADLNVNWLSPVKVRQSILSGDRRMLVYDDLEPTEKIKIYDSGVTVSGTAEELYKMRISYRIGDMTAPHLAATEALRTEVDHFADCVQNGATPVTGGTMGLQVVEVLENATRSMRDRGRPIDMQPLRRAS